MAIIMKRGTDLIIAQDDNKSLRDLCVDNRTNLSGADLFGANLSGANLYRADLFGADLSGANLYRADLYRADLFGADLSRADLSRADLSRADLYRANLSGADLSGANLYRANLSGADLSRANLEFHQFPSIRLLSSIPLGRLSDDLSLELLRRDAYAHPFPGRFNEWKKSGKCPYQNEEYFWHFSWQVVRHLWKPGSPEMRDSDLILAICKEKGWKIKGYK